jgi:hypothetical protein
MVVAALSLIRDSGYAERASFERMLIFGSITSASWVVEAKGSELQKD